MSKSIINLHRREKILTLQLKTVEEKKGSEFLS